MNLPVSEIEIEDAEVLAGLLGDNQEGEGALKQAKLLMYVPHKPYYDGLHKQELLIKSALDAVKQGIESRPLLLWGMGGLGKSTLAAQLARSLVHAEVAEMAFWASMGVVPTKPTEPAVSVREKITACLAAQLGLLDQFGESLDARLFGIVEKGVLECSLLVVDNLDATTECVGDLCSVLEMLRPKHVILTCRSMLDLPHCYPLKVQPLDGDDSELFLQTDATRRGLEAFLPHTKRVFAEICEATGGVPFAVQLALGQATRMPWHSVLEGLRAAHSELYVYLFRGLWRSLGPRAQKALVYMRTAPDGIELDELVSVGILGSRDEVSSTMAELVRLSLIEVEIEDDSSASYSIHPLTYNFIVSDLPHVWAHGNER